MDLHRGVYGEPLGVVEIAPKLNHSHVILSTRSCCRIFRSHDRQYGNWRVLARQLPGCRRCPVNQSCTLVSDAGSFSRSCASADIKRCNPMTTVRIPGGVVHDLPADLQTALAFDAQARAAWEDITPLARNEWICWTISVKKDETRRQHVERVCSELKEGMRRPCCWPGCPHR